MTNKQYLLYGFGISLEAVAKYLHSRQIPFCVCDDSPDALEKAKSYGYRIIYFKEVNYGDFTDLVVAPGLPPNHVVFNSGLTCWNDISLFFDLHKNSLNKVITVTGSFGKSTTVSLIKHVHDKLIGPIELGGNIGIPIFNCDPKLPIVLELSAQQLELCNLPVDIGVILNIYSQHLDRYGSLLEYSNTKTRILSQAKVKIGNASLVNTVNTDFQTISDSIEADFSFRGTSLFENGNLVTNLQTRISHISFLGAFAVLRNLNLQALEIIHAMDDFAPLAHRCEVVIVPGLENLLFINDSKSTNLLNAVYCLKKFSPGRIGWICGGKFAEQDLSVLEQLPSVHYIATTGSSGKFLLEHFRDRIDIDFFQSLRDAINACIIKGSTTIIFSPGYSSLDEYRNFVERGNYFKAIVKNEL